MRVDWRWALLTSLVFVSQLAHAITANHYGYAYALHTNRNSDIYRFALTPDVYAHVGGAAGLPELVVVNALGQSMPLARVPPAQYTEFATKVRLKPIAANQQGEPLIAAWLIDAAQRIELERLDVAVREDMRMVEHRYAIDGSDDLRSWMMLKEFVNYPPPQPIVNRLAASGGQATTADIKLGSSPEESAIRHLSISIDEPMQLPLRYYRLRIVGNQDLRQQQESEEATLSGRIPESGLFPQLQWVSTRRYTTNTYPSTPYAYSLPSALPVTAVRIPATSVPAPGHFSLWLMTKNGPVLPDNFRAVELNIFGTDHDKDFSYLLRWGPTNGAMPPIITGLRLSEFGSISSIDMPVLQAGWEPAVFAFLAKGPGPYRLLAGSYLASRDNAQGGTVLQRLRDITQIGQAPQATLGEAKELGGVAALQAPADTPNAWTRPLLWLALIVMLLLVVGIVKLST